MGEAGLAYPPKGTGMGTLGLRRGDDNISSNGHLSPGWIKWEAQLKEYLAYYHESRTHLGLDKDAPEPRIVQALDVGPVSSEPVLRGLHHRYFRQAA